LEQTSRATMKTEIGLEQASRTTMKQAKQTLLKSRKCHTDWCVGGDLLCRCSCL